MKNIPKKNYIILFVILFASIALIFYFYLWYDAYKQNNLNNSVMNNYLNVITYNELESYIVENKKVFVYVSVLKDEKIKKFEYEFKGDILKNNIKNKILYMDVSNYIEYNELSYNINDYNIPCILVFEDGKLINNYNIKKGNYESKKVIAFMISEGILEND